MSGLTNNERAFVEHYLRALRLPTPRQRQILQLMANGKTQREIAIEFGIAYNSVKNTMRYFRERIGAKSSFHAVAIAMRKGWIK